MCIKKSLKISIWKPVSYLTVQPDRFNTAARSSNRGCSRNFSPSSADECVPAFTKILICSSTLAWIKWMIILKKILYEIFSGWNRSVYSSTFKTYHSLFWIDIHSIRNWPSAQDDGGSPLFISDISKLSINTYTPLMFHSSTSVRLIQLLVICTQTWIWFRCCLSCDVK